MKFLHAADIHLDSPLAGLRLRDDLPSEVIRHCTRRGAVAWSEVDPISWTEIGAT